MARDFKKYAVTMVIDIDPDAPFLELENGENEDVVLELFKDTVYDLDDIKLKEIEVEFLD